MDRGGATGLPGAGETADWRWFGSRAAWGCWSQSRSRRQWTELWNRRADISGSFGRLSEVEINAEAHKQARANQADRQRLMQCNQTDDRSDEGRCGEISPGPRCSYFSEREDEQDEAQPVAGEPHQRGSGHQAQSGELAPRYQRERRVRRAGDDPLD